ncbi:hypothetical protein HK098_002035 [Nowakowskiella sp. JEL0407]|nr:hypothetical protein HK098_002035 [Nowakowskiella sp. JEL0407]
MRLLRLLLLLAPLGLVDAQNCLPPYSQCDGKNWAMNPQYSNCCTSGYYCKVIAEQYYSQCYPIEGYSPPVSPVASPSHPAQPSPQVSPNSPQSSQPPPQQVSPAPQQQSPMVQNSPLTVAVVYRTITTVIPLVSTYLDSNGNRVVQTTIQIIAIQSPEPQPSSRSVNAGGTVGDGVDSGAAGLSPVIIGIIVAALMGIMVVMLIIYFRRKSAASNDKSRGSFYQFRDTISAPGSLKFGKNFQQPDASSSNTAVEVYHVQPTTNSTNRRSDLIRFSNLSNPFKDPVDSESGHGSVYYEPASNIALRLETAASTNSRFSYSTSSHSSFAYRDTNPFNTPASVGRKNIHKNIIHKNHNSDPFRERALSTSTQLTNDTGSSNRSSMPAFYALQEEGVDGSNNTLNPDWEDDKLKDFLKR